MKKYSLTMNQKISLLTFFILISSFTVAGTLLLHHVLQESEVNAGQKAMLVARTVSDLPDVKNQLENTDLNEASAHLQPLVEKLQVINQSSYIVVLTMDQIRLTHPNKQQLLTKSASSDLNAAFGENYYTSKAKGEQAYVIRAFSPVLNEAKEQIGVVIAAYSLPTFTDLFITYKGQALITILLVLSLSTWGAYMLARHMKKQMFGLEPEQIARLYVERSETFNAMHEGIIAVDQNLTITIFNQKAHDILGVDFHPNQYIGQNIYTVLPDTRLPEIVESKQPVYNQEIFVNSHSIVSNRIPIFVDGKIVGAVAVFKDLTEFKQLAEELTGVKAFVQALRIQSHEYKNKLHTIAGLLQLGHHQQALEYVATVKENHEQVTKFLNERIYNESISGLILSKINRGKELGIRVVLDEESHMKQIPHLLDHHDFVLLIGNLIENAYDALTNSEQQDKEIHLSIDDSDGCLAILVSDNGIGIAPELLPHIFTNGFSTKSKENRGIGLHLVQEIVKKGNGHIEVTSDVAIGTVFIITFDL